MYNENLRRREGDIYRLYVIDGFQQTLALHPDHTGNDVNNAEQNVLSYVVHTISGVIHNAKCNIYRVGRVQI